MLLTFFVKYDILLSSSIRALSSAGTSVWFTPRMSAVRSRQRPSLTHCHIRTYSILYFPELSRYQQGVCRQWIINPLNEYLSCFSIHQITNQKIIMRNSVFMSIQGFVLFFMRIISSR
ncbi:hypothetical protein TPHV1_130075 [Treponema phagedenis]|uniref:Uncharacterized protein n=1 Tax=Treponema phagedenis TaxID=162 RepID=A0A0B7GU46_TREPH|nr:hypothetical protein TPHV1_130075 [Treponema phagedenis]